MWVAHSPNLRAGRARVTVAEALTACPRFKVSARPRIVCLPALCGAATSNVATASPKSATCQPATRGRDRPSPARQAAMVRQRPTLSLPWLQWTRRLAHTRPGMASRRQRDCKRRRWQTMTRKAKVMPPPQKPGRPDGWTPTSEVDHFEKCPMCGHMIDCRDLAEVMEHIEPHEAPPKN